MKNDYKKLGNNKYYLLFLNNVALYTSFKNFQFGGTEKSIKTTVIKI